MNSKDHLSWALALILCSTSCPTSAQAYIPDTAFRNAVNEWIPGLVDNDGIMDTLHPSIATTDSIFLSMTSTGAIDMEGIQYLDSLDYLMVSVFDQNFEPVDLIVQSFPHGLDRLFIGMNSGSITLGQLPDSMLTLSLSGQAGETSAIVALMPSHTTNIILYNLGSLEWESAGRVENLNLYKEQLPWGSTVNLPSIDIGQLNSYWSLGGFLNFSAASAELVVIEAVGLEGIALPVGVTSLQVSGNIAQSFCMPWLPDGLTSLYLANYQGRCIPNWPASLVEYYDGYGSVNANTANYCSVLNTTCPGYNPGISGHILMDLNQNGQCDPGEPPLPQASVTLSPNGNVTGCDANGYWEIGVQPGNYTITPSSSYPYIQTISPTQHTANLPNMGEADTQNDFAVTLIPDMQDLRGHFYAEPARPGFDNRLFLTCQNYGTVPMDAQLTLEYDADQTWVGSSTAPTTHSGTTATWQLGTLAIGALQQITVDLNTSTTVTLGTPIVHSLSALPNSNDETPLDNMVVITDSVVGSYDPNDKLLSPERMTPEEVSTGQKPITYTIRFQNTGTYLAERVVVVDTLPEGLQPQSIEFLSSSHSCHWYVLDGVLHFIHEGINLPDSTSDEPGSHGYVQFRILPDTDLSDGAEVANIAHIVFDFNAPIVTPPAVFSVDIEAGVVDLVHNAALQLLPNPAQDRIQIRLPTPAAVQYRINDALGRQVLTGSSVHNGWIDVVALPAGAYVLDVRSGDERYSARFVKQ